MKKQGLKTCYAAYDLHPSFKGASTHIEKFFAVMKEISAEADLFVLGNKFLPEHERRDNALIYRLVSNERNLFKKADEFIDLIIRRSFGKEYDLCHFRDIWSCMALSLKKCKKVFEVNGLPSLELSERYVLHEKAVEFLRQTEDKCLQEADKIVVPAFAIKNYLVSQRGVPEEKITVITNGADMPVYEKPKKKMPEDYIIYFGALQKWQGIDVLLKAFSFLLHIQGLHLVIVSSLKQKRLKLYKKLANRLKISPRVIWLDQLPKPRLNYLIKNAKISVAPLKFGNRNVLQGFSPIKIFESMANLTPVIASDLPSVREILTHNKTALLTYPERPDELARHIEILLNYPAIAKTLAENAYELFTGKYQWKFKQDELKQLYLNLLTT